MPATSSIYIHASAGLSAVTAHDAVESQTLLGSMVRPDVGELSDEYSHGFPLFLGRIKQLTPLPENTQNTFKSKKQYIDI